ncbi:MAG: hypothetical protein AAGI28_08590 [Pseudomonadota bacterium]
MEAISRRGLTLQLAGLGGAAFCVSTGAFAQGGDILAIPNRPLQLVRAIEHVFFDGAFLSVFRSWQVEFVRVSRGINVLGKATQVSVDASPSRLGLAAAERERVTAGMWPIRLSATGLILTMGADQTGDTLTDSLALNTMPDDLFYPSLGPLTSDQTVMLPNGAVGEFTLRYEAKGAVGTGWLDRAERRVTTRIGETVESAFERWRLTDI